MVSRIEPQGPAAAYKTFSWSAPPDTHLVIACSEAGCLAWRHGWETTVDERTDLGMMQAAYIRQRSGRTFTEQRTGDGLTVFRFEAHQRCFAEHKTRPQRLLERGGDWRGNPRGDSRVHASVDDWVDSFRTTLEGVKEAQERG